MEETLNIIELFGSVQGETTFSGLPTFFVRLASCNLRCTWCDTTYSFGRGNPVALTEIYEQIKTSGLRYVCVTGGEPLLQPLVFPFMTHLCDRGYILSLETSGSLSIAKVDPRVRTILDIKCPASGMSEKNDWSNLELLRAHDEVKFVVQDEADYVYAKEVYQKYNLSKKVSALLISPVFGKLDPQEVVKWMLQDRLPFRLNMQIHKFIWSPETKGV